MWNAFSAALAKRPAVIAPFVTRPNEKVLDRKALGLAPATEAAQGVYLLKAADGKSDGTSCSRGAKWLTPLWKKPCLFSAEGDQPECLLCGQC